ncbi:MAG TPA: acetamidase/formamidase family protein, partial [Thermomicrobiales bacterium]|nr:acetamidase/formamidase family protein [Thermomicrobiales bacterium]
THEFHPTTYFNTMGSHSPVLTIVPGDTVVTTTVDARGVDAGGNQVATRGNPQTGPFFIEGAEPGDTLVVHLDKLAPNRPTGWSARVLATNVVDPDFVRNLPGNPIVPWNVDMASGEATLAEPIPGLEALRVPVVPMLGCFGVAASGGQAISTATSAEHGGNMDYRGFKQGATVYFPVFTEGALFHLGDGHAAQGDGEIAGTGIEISFDVEFTVELRKGETIGWPRGENEDYIFTAGNARPLDQALQHATTEMVAWLERDYGLDVIAASTLMGQCVEYEVGNVFDPAYTMICKMPKRILRQLQKP